MDRARSSRRFAHPDHLENSHRGFARHFESYLPHFKKVSLYWNAYTTNNAPTNNLIAKQDGTRSYPSDQAELREI